MRNKKQIGVPLFPTDLPPDATWDGTGDRPPGFGWVLSPETRKVFEEINHNIRLAHVRARTMISD